MNLDHSQLVERAAHWMIGSQRLCPVLLEPGYGDVRERPDVIGWKQMVSTVVEVKVTRSDFHKDKQKRCRAVDAGMGRYRWYFTEKGLIEPHELPHGWGLLELRGDRVFKVRQPILRSATSFEIEQAYRLLWGFANNIQLRERGVYLGDTRWHRQNLGYGRQQFKQEIYEAVRTRDRERREAVEEAVFGDVKEWPGRSWTQILQAIEEREKAEDAEFPWEKMSVWGREMTG